MISKNKGQISVFIILGIVVLIFLFFIFSIRSNLVAFSSMSQESSSAESLKKYVDNCMQIYLEETVDILMRQGGFLYFENDFGSYYEDRVNNIYFPGSNLTISNSLNNDISELLKIPKNFKGTNQNPSLFNHIFSDQNSAPFFGNVNLPKLCLVDGVNSHKNAYSNYTCIPNMYNYGKIDENLSIQHQMQKIISTRFMSCFESERINLGYDAQIISQGNFYVIFGDEHIQISSDWWIRLKEGDKISRIPIEYSYPIRLKKLYQFVYSILDRESKDINFNISGELNQISFYDPQFTVELFPVDNSNSQLLVVKDLGSKISFPSIQYLNDVGIVGSTYSQGYLTFFGLINNRRPYIEKIDDLDLLENVNQGSFSVFVLDPDLYDVESITFSLDLISTEVNDQNRWVDLYPDFIYPEILVFTNKTKIDNGLLEVEFKFDYDYSNNNAILRNNDGYHYTRHFMNFSIVDPAGNSDYQEFIISLYNTGS